MDCEEEGERDGERDRQRNRARQKRTNESVGGRQAPPRKEGAGLSLILENCCNEA